MLHRITEDQFDALYGLRKDPMVIRMTKDGNFVGF